MAGNIDSKPVFIVDSSFLLSILLPDEKILEPHLSYVKDFRRSKNFFKSCELLKYEICNSLKSAVKQKRITVERAKILLSGFKLMKIEYLDLEFEQVLKISIDNDLSFYDASYLYLAKKTKSKLLTLDKRLEKIMLQ